MIALALIFVLLVVNLLLHALAIKLGAKWAKVPNVSFRRAVVVTLVLGLASLVVSALAGCVLGFFRLTPFGMTLLPLAATALVECLVVGVLLRTSVGRGILAWLPKLGATVVMLAVLFFVVKPFVTEGFVQTSHSMAPTLLGSHNPGTCPHCGGEATVGSAVGLPVPDDRLGICSACQQTGEVRVHPRIMLTAADRFVVCKFLPPARWDVVVVHSPPPSSALVTKRVVGLPGEEVVIRDGGIWINGTRQEPPADIAKLRYTTAPEGSPEDWGTPDKPARLGPDECFVLGDFSLRSVDSRTWGPVPRKDITGVVSLVYFPFYRVRVLK